MKSKRTRKTTKVRKLETYLIDYVLLILESDIFSFKIVKRPPMAKIDKSWLLVDINGLFEGVIWRPSKSKKSWPGVGKERGEKEKQNFRKIKKIAQRRGG